MSEPAATSQEQKAGNKLPSVSPFFSSLLFASPTYTLIIISHSVSPFLSLSKFVCVHLRFAFFHHHRHPSSPASYFSHTSTVAVFAKTKQKLKLNLLEKGEHIKLSPGVRTWGDLLLDRSSSNNNKMSENQIMDKNTKCNCTFQKLKRCNKYVI